MWKESNWKHWRLVAKLDPDKPITREALLAVNHPGFDAVIVGGTQGINSSNTDGLIEQIRISGYSGQLVQEISNPEVVAMGVDAHLIPLVLNAGHKKWLLDYHLQAVKMYRDLINWDNILTQGYLVCNPASAVGKLTGAGELDVDDALAYLRLAEGIYNLPLLYIEYSGVFGDVPLVKEVSCFRRNIHLIYGGGITTVEQAITMGELVDTIVIGNIVHENPARAVEIAQKYDMEKGSRRRQDLSGGRPSCAEAKKPCRNAGD